jgi:AcrR family transcriptional regulator
MPRTEEQNRKIRDERQEQIQRAALKVFARRGMAAAKIGDIAKEAGLSHGLVYHYFASKEEVFTTLVRKALEGSSLVVQYAKMQPGTPLDQMRWLTQNILQSVEGEGAHLFLLMTQAFTSDAVPLEVKRMLHEDNVSAAVKETVPILIAGQEAGVIVKDDPVRLAVLFYSLIQGLAISRIQQPDVPLPDADMVLRFLTVK